MLDHMRFRVTNIAATRELYEAALAPLGYKVLHEFECDGQKMFGMGFDTTEGVKTKTGSFKVRPSTASPSHAAAISHGKHRTARQSTRSTPQR